MRVILRLRYKLEVDALRHNQRSWVQSGDLLCSVAVYSVLFVMGGILQICSLAVFRRLAVMYKQI